MSKQNEQKINLTQFSKKYSQNAVKSHDETMIVYVLLSEFEPYFNMHTQVFQHQILSFQLFSI